MEKPTLYESLIQSIRILDELEGGGLVRRFLERPQHHFDETEERIRTLSDTDSPGTCPAALLPYLKDHVGFGGLSTITDRLSTAALRKLINTAVPFWRQKGTGIGATSVAVQFTGRIPFMQDWFDYRFVVGETQIGQDQLGTDPWVITGQLPEPGEFLTTLLVMDDGSIDPVLFADLLGLMRPTNERIEAILLDFLDTFGAARDRWTALGSAPAEIVDGVFALSTGALEEAIITVVPFENRANYTSVHKFALGASGNKHRVYWYHSDLGRLSIKLSDQSPQIVIEKWAISTPTTIYSGDLVGGVSLVPGSWSKLRIETVNDPAAYLKVYVEGVLQYESPTGGEDTTIAYGDFRIAAPLGTVGVNLVDNVEIWRRPMRWALIGPDGLTVSESFYSEAFAAPAPPPPPPPPPPSLPPYAMPAGRHGDEG